jgi:multidrug resistance efflux pump
MFKYNRKLISIFLLLVFTAFAIGGCAAPASSEISVQVASAQKQAIKTNISLSGVLLPQSTVTLSTKLTGQVLSVNCDVGAAVKKGDTLISLDTKQLSAQLDQAEAALKQANAAVKAGKSSASASSSAVKVAQGAVDTAKINYDAAKKAYDATKASYDLGFATAADLEKATVALQVAQAQYTAASSGTIKQAKYASSSASNNVNTLKAGVEVAEANVNLILVQMENAAITSPVDGVVISRNINTGELAVTGAQLVTVMENGAYKLKGTVPQSALPLISVGQSINVTVDIYPSQKFEGKISMIAPMAVSTGEYFPIEVTIPSAEVLKAGLSAHASLEVQSQERVCVPSNAVISESGQSYVFVYDNGTAKKTAVTAGLSDGTLTEILEGLSSDAQVITTQTGAIKDGTPVSAL